MMKGGVEVDQVKIGNFLKKLRKEKGITQEQLAEILNVSGRTVSRWETGVSKPSTENIKTISLLCGISTDYLIKKNHPLEISLYNIDDQAYKILKDLINYFRERNENVENHEK